MSMWDWDEQGESYPPEDRQHYRDPYASHSGGSSDYRGAHQSYGDHSHHHHGHTSHNHDHHHHHQQDDAHHSYHGQRSAGASPSRHNYGLRHESYGDPGAHQNYGGRETIGEEDRGRHKYGWHDSNDDLGDDRNSYGSPAHVSNMAHAPVRQSAHYQDNEGYDSSAGYEIRQEHHSPPPPTTSGHGHEASNRTDLFTSDSVVNSTLDEIDALARTHRSRSWLVVLYAPWCRFCQV